MKRIIFNSIALALSCTLPVMSVSAQQAEPEISSLVKVEYFDWYAEREAAEPSAIKNFYRRGLPEGKSANYPTADEPARRKDSEKFIYRVRIRNLSDKEIVSIVWRYEFVNPLTKQLASSLEFESRARIKPHKRKTLYVESFSPPAQTVDVNLLLLNKTRPFTVSIAVKSLIFAAVPKSGRSKGKAH